MIDQKPNESSAGRVLKGIDAIREFISPGNPISRRMVTDLIKAGMPARLIGNTWFTHTDHVVEFMKKYTLVNNQKLPIRNSGA